MTIPTPSTTMMHDGVQVQWISDNKERGVLATRAFSVGETLFEETPQVSAQYLYNSLYFPACEYCQTCLETPKQQAARLSGLESEDQLELPLATELIAPVPRLGCPTCDAEYCSDACRSQAWNAYHQLLCPGVCTPHQVTLQQQIIDEWKSFHYPPETATITLLLKMVAMMCVAGSEEVFTSHFKADKSNSALAIAAKFLDEQFADRIATFAGLFRERFAGLSTGGFECTPDVFEKAFTIVALNGQGIGTSAVEHFERVLRKTAEDKSAAVDPSLVEHALEVVDMLRELIAEHSDEFTHAEGTGLYRMHAMLNHACDANAQIEFAHGSHRLAVKATKDIAAGEEVTLCYMDFGGCGDECGEGSDTEGDQVVMMDADGVVASSSSHHHHHHHHHHEDDDDDDELDEEEADVETRRAQLREYYLFDCMCNKCVAESAQQ